MKLSNLKRFVIFRDTLIHILPELDKKVYQAMKYIILMCVHIQLYVN